MKCKIRWIDEHGNPTPDDNEAVAMAHCHEAIWSHPNGSPDNQIVGYSDEIVATFPICQAHLDRMPTHWRGHRVWSVSPLPNNDEQSS